VDSFATTARILTLSKTAQERNRGHEERASREKMGLLRQQITDNKYFFLVAATKNFAAATERFADRTKHFVVVTKYFCCPYFIK